MPIDYQLARELSYSTATSIYNTMKDGKDFTAQAISQKAIQHTENWQDYRPAGNTFDWHAIVDHYHGPKTFIEPEFYYDVALWKNGTLMGVSLGYVIVRQNDVRLEVVETVPPKLTNHLGVSKPKRFFEFVSIAYHAFAAAAKCEQVVIVDPKKDLVEYYMGFGYTRGKCGFLYRKVEPL